MKHGFAGVVNAILPAVLFALAAFLPGPSNNVKFEQFHSLFFHALAKIQGIVYGLIAWLVIDAVAIAHFEKMPFADALYFTLVTGLTIGYGDIAPVTPTGRVVAILTGLLGILITGLIVAVAVYAVRETMEQQTNSH
jgi:voltage-gated potassium channel